MKTKPSTRAARNRKPSAPRKRPAQKAAASLASFPIVGIGTSAGGLAALEQFFKNLPAASGMAFVVIQHLDPNHKGMLPELLQRSTTLPVKLAEHRLAVQPDHVYVIPSNRDIGIRYGRLLLAQPAKTRGLHLPIDSFFSALATNSGQLAIGVILSGMGSDGTRGSREIKSRGGLVAVQEPKSADFDSMPRSVIASKCADLVAPPGELPARLIALYRKSAAAPDALPELDVKVEGEMGVLIALLRARTGHDFSLYKRATLHRRIERRMGIHQLQSIGDYVNFLRANPVEVDLLFKEMLIGVTNFFRDPAAWNHLRDKAIPALLKHYHQGEGLRAWVAGCSTGEEAYSLAIAFREALAKSKLPGRSLQIFATDLDGDAIDTARAGFYPAGITQDVGAERLFRYFTREEDGYRINPEVREMVTFAVQDVIHDPPFTKLDILCCRNLFIYFDTGLQKKVLALFHYSLKPSGILLLGHAETAGHSSKLFAPLKSKLPLYQRLPGQRTRALEFPTAQLRMLDTPAAAEPARPALKLQAMAEQMLLQRFCPTAVLVNGDGDILYISGRTGDYLEPASGKANWNLYAMVREELRNDVTSLLNRALRQKGEFTLKNLRTGRGKQLRRLSVTAQALKHPEELHGMALVTFIPADLSLADKRGARRPATSPRAAELEEALRRAHEENRAIRESINTTQEELKSANEELQSTNEELQSTNEELTTSKEEMQSMNEELQTVNAELQARVDELTRASSDMKNLLDSTEIITLFLDEAFHVRLFTQHATQLFKLIPGDVGRALSDIVTDLSYPGLQQDAAQVLRTLVFSDKQVQTQDGRWFRVRIMPYRTLANVIDGVVITCTNITEAKRLEMKLRADAR